LTDFCIGHIAFTLGERVLIDQNRTNSSSTSDPIMASPSDELINLAGGLSLYQADEVLPEYVSSGDDASTIGSSVSQTMQTTDQMQAAMVENAMAMITNLQEQVHYSLVIQYIIN
jgi:hypothetical protein